jgi:putative DNA methylase
MSEPGNSMFRRALQISHERIAAMSDSNLNMLMEMLIKAQARKCGSPLDEIRINTQGNAPDGGCDGWSAKPTASDGWLGSEDTCWQWLLHRRSKKFTAAELAERMTTGERSECCTWANRIEAETDRAKVKTLKEQRSQWMETMQDKLFLRLPYDEKLTNCDRPEQVDGPSLEAWTEINTHLGTNAQSLPELVEQLGQSQFGHTPRLGDAFCGGGSIPFEAARIGCDAYGSDLNPVAALLTWAALNIVGGGSEILAGVKRAQEEIYQRVDEQVTAWRIEQNETGQRADAYLYCCEVVCPETGWRVPLAPSWVIGEKTCCVAQLVPDYKNKRYNLRIKNGATEEEMARAKAAGTVKDSYLVHPILKEQGKQPTSIKILRGDRVGAKGTTYGLRMWENEDLVPRPYDVFQERLYCIRWAELYVDHNGHARTRRRYAEPEPSDYEREEKVLHSFASALRIGKEKAICRA